MAAGRVQAASAQHACGNLPSHNSSHRFLAPTTRHAAMPPASGPLRQRRWHILILRLCAPRRRCRQTHSRAAARPLERPGGSQHSSFSLSCSFPPAMPDCACRCRLRKQAALGKGERQSSVGGEAELGAVLRGESQETRHSRGYNHRGRATRARLGWPSHELGS